MATLYFRVDADYDEAIKCKKEIDSLTKSLDKVSTTGTQKEIENLERRLSAARVKFANLIDTAEKSGAELERDFNKNMQNIAVELVQVNNEFLKQKETIASLKKEIVSYEDELVDALKKGDSAKQLSLKQVLAEKNNQLGLATDNMLSAVTRSGELELQARQLRQEYNLINGLDNDIKAKGVNAIAEAFGVANDNGRTFLGVLNQIGQQATGVAVGNILSNGLMGAVDMAVDFKNQIFETRKYFQDVESSMKIFLGDAEKATEFTEKLQEYAYYNMFDYEQLVGASKQLIAYGNDVNNVIPILDKLSEIATGTGNSVNSLVDMYNRAKSIGYVDSRSLMTWASQGIVVKDILKEMGETGIGTRVTFEQLNKALDYVTRQGGMFGGVMKAQMDNLSASMGQLDDNLSLMRNEIGKSLEPILKGQIDLQSELVENWKTVVKVIGGVIVTYGVLKAALATNIFLQKLEKGLLSEAITLRKKNNAAMVAQSVSLKNLTLGLKAYTSQMWKATAATLANPWTWVAAAIATATAAIWAHAVALDEEERAAERVDKALEAKGELLKQQREEEEKLAETIGNVNRSEREKIQAYEKLSQTLPELTKKYNEYQLSQMSPEERKKVVEQAQQEQDQTSRDTALAEASKVIDEDVKRARNWKGQLLDAVSGSNNAFVQVAREWADNTDSDLASFVKKIDFVRGLSDKYLTGQYDWNLYDYDEEQVKKINDAYQKIADTQHIAAEDRKTDTREQLADIRDFNNRLEEAKKKEEEENEIIRRRKLALDEQLSLEEQDLKSINNHRQFVSGLIDELKTVEDTQELYKDIEVALENAPRDIKIDFKPGMSKEDLSNLLIRYLKTVNEDVDKKDGKISAIKTEMTSIMEQTPSAMRKKALKNRILIESVQRKLAHGNYNFTDPELEACGVNPKELTGDSEFASLIIKAVKNKGVDSGDRDTLKNKINTELQNIKNDQETAGQNIIDKENQTAYKLSEMRRKNAQEYARQATDAVHAATQAEIDAMYDGFEKRNAQRRLDHQKELERIKREKEDKVKAAEDKARAEWVAENPDYNKEFNWNSVREKYLKNNADYQSAIANAIDVYATAMGKEDVKFSNGIALVNQYTSSLEKARESTRKYMDEYGQLTAYMANLDSESAEYRRALDAREELTRQHIQNLTKDYESYDVKRINLEQKFADKKKEVLEQIAIIQEQINGTTDDEERSRLNNQVSLLNSVIAEVNKKQGEELANIQGEQMKKSLEKLKKDPTFFMAFRDMTQISSDSLSGLMKELEGLSSEISNLDPKDVEVISGLMSKIDEELIRRDPSGAISKLSTELNSLSEQQKIAEEELTHAKKEDTEASVALADAEMALAIAKSVGTTDDEKEKQRLLNEAQERRAMAAERLQRAQNKVNNLTIRVQSVSSSIDKIVDSTRNKIAEIGNLLAQIGQQVGGKVGEIMEDVSSIINDLVKVSELYSQYQDSKKTSGSGNVTQDATNMASSLSQNAGSGGNAKAASAMGNVAAVMQGIQLGISVGSKIAEIMEKTGATASAKYEKYAKKQAEINKLTNSVNAYAYAALKAQHAEEHWFGNSAIQSMKDSWAEAEKAKDNYFVKLKEQQATYKNEAKHDGDWLGNIIAGSVAGAITGAVIGSSAGPWGTLAGAAIGGVVGGAAGATTSYAEQALGNSNYKKQTTAARDNLRIETRSKKKSFMWIGGHDQKSENLVDWAKKKYGADLFDAEGWINVELYDQIKQDFGDKLLGETEKTLDELKELKEKYDEYQEQLKDYVKGLYEPLVANMTDALWEWLANGRDALSSFREFAASTFKSIINDMLQQIVLSKVVGSFQDEIKDVYDSYFAGNMSEDSLMSNVSRMTEDLMRRYEVQMPMLQRSLETMTDIVQGVTGIDVSQGSSSGSTSGVQASFSQDSIDEANGRMASIQMAQQMQLKGLDEINGNVSELISYAVERNQGIIDVQRQIADSYLELQGIHSDTSSMKNTLLRMMNDYMQNWDEHVKSL